MPINAQQPLLSQTYLTRGWLDGTDYEAQEENIAQNSDFANAAKYALEAINGEIPFLSIEEAFDVENEENNEIFWSIQFNSAAVEDPVKDGSYQQAQFGAYLGGSENQEIRQLTVALLLHYVYSKCIVGVMHGWNKLLC